MQTFAGNFSAVNTHVFMRGGTGTLFRGTGIPKGLHALAAD